MKKYPQGKFNKFEPDQLRLKEGGGCLSLFGLPFFFAGIFVALIGLGVIPVENASELTYWLRFIILIMGLIFTCVGGILVFGRRWIIIDISKGVILKQWGLVVPMKQKEINLYMYDAVLIKLKTGDSDSADTYSVELRAKDGSKPFDLYNSANYGDSHEQAMIVAEFLKLPVNDNSTEHEVVIDSHLPEKLSIDRSFERQEDPVSVPQPPVMQSMVEETANETSITIPEKRFGLFKIIKYFPPVLVLIFILPQVASFFHDTDTPDIVKYIFIGIGILIFGLIPFFGFMISIIRAGKSSKVMIVKADGIQFEYRGIFNTKRKIVSITDVLGLDYSTTDTIMESVRKKPLETARGDLNIDYSSIGYDGKTPKWVQIIKKFVKSRGIIIKSREGIITFGEGLPDEEVVYLYNIVKKRVKGKA